MDMCLLYLSALRSLLVSRRPVVLYRLHFVLVAPYRFVPLPAPLLTVHNDLELIGTLPTLIKWL